MVFVVCQLYNLTQSIAKSYVMETKGFEPSTFALRTRRSPS